MGFRYKEEINIGCPFYRSMERETSRKYRVSCEGPSERGTMSMEMFSLADLDTQVRVFCCENWKKCEVYRLLMTEKYDMELIT